MANSSSPSDPTSTAPVATDGTATTNVAPDVTPPAAPQAAPPQQPPAPAAPEVTAQLPGTLEPPAPGVRPMVAVPVEPPPPRVPLTGRLWFRTLLWVLTSPGRLLRYMWRAEPLSQKTTDVLAGFMTLGSLILTAWVARNVLLKFPNSADEDDYVWVAQRLLEGHLSLPAPAVPEAIAFWWRKVVDGRMICQYPPSWPALMAPFVLLGVPWMANPTISAITVFLVYRIGRDIYGSPATGIAAGLFLATNAFFLLNGGAFFAHPSVLMMMALTIWLFCRATLGQGTTVERPWRAGLLTGISAGFLASIRTPDAWAGLFFTSAICTFWMLARNWRQWVRFIPASMVGAVVGIMPLLAHNKWSTGHWSKTAYTLFTPDVVAPKFEWEFMKSRAQTLVEYRNDFANWTFDPIYCVVLFALALFAPGNWKQRLTDVGIFGIVPMVAANVVAFPLSALHYNSYGPRYAFILLIPMALLLGRALVAVLAHRRLTWLLLLPIFYLHNGQVEKYKGVYGARVKERMTLIRAMETAKVDNVVVFMKTNTADMDKWDLTRNDGEYKNPVIYALDVSPGMTVEAWQKMFPGRRAYSWSYEGSPGRGSLTALEPATGRATGKTVRMHDAVLQGPLPEMPPSTMPPYHFTGTELHRENGTAMGSEWNLWANGDARMAVNLPVAGKFRFTIWLRGRTAKGELAHAEIVIDGEKVREVDLPEGNYQPYVVENLDLKPGYHGLGVKFTNDYNDSGQDRDLHIQKASLEYMPAAPAQDAPAPTPP